MVPISPSPQTEPRDIEAPPDDYRPVSGLAIGGLLVSFCSALALIHPVLWVVPLSGIFFSGLALRRIATASPPLLGRKAALVGMTISLIFGLAAPLQYWAHRRALRAEALEIANEWFTALRENRPDYAVRLSQQPTTKAARALPPLTDGQKREQFLQSVRDAIHQQPMELLLKLGKKAHVRLVKNNAVWHDEASEGVRDTFAVTVGSGSEAVSFFVRLSTLRSQDRATGQWQWQITKHDFISSPDSDVLEAFE